MSNKEIYKALGIEKGDALSLMQIIRIAEMRSRREAARQACGAEVRPVANEETTLPGRGRPAGRKFSDEALRAAVRGLNPADDSHWTRRGLPALQAVARRIGTTALRRADIERLLPGYDRAAARG